MKKYFLAIVILSKQFSAFAQYVGIGNNFSHIAKLEVSDVAGNGKTSAIFGGESPGISFQRDWPTIGFNQYRDSPDGNGKFISGGFAAIQYMDPASGYLAIDMIPPGNTNEITQNPKRALTIYNQGIVNIGQWYYNSSLGVARNAGSNATAYLFGTTHASAFNFGTDENTYIRAGKNNGIVFINDIPGSKISMNGFVGINTATPGCPLEIRQTGNDIGLLLVDPNTFNNWGFQVSSLSGALLLVFNGVSKGRFDPSTGNYTTVSDIRLKKNIKSLPSLIDKVIKLKPVKYEMINDNSAHEKNIGFIAQGVKKIFPELVTVSSDTRSGYKGITDLHTLDYSGFNVIAIKTIQEQQEIIKKQDKAIQAMKNKLTELKKQLSKFN